MLKRDHFDEPSTPTAESKRPRESSGSHQELRTPLKNASNSASFDFISPRRPAEEEEERRRNRAELVKKQQESREALRSPAANASPRAESPSSLTSNLKRSGAGSGSGLINDFTPNSGSSPNSLTAHGTRSFLTASKSKLSLSSAKLSTTQPPLALTVEQMTKSFDEWMKMAADNKINSKNSWNFALIDYFSELTFLRDGDSINFQKASCTLDGCVKIYASRVDSVVDETTKLLNGLSDKTNKFKFDSNEDNEDNENASNNPNEKQQKSKLKKTSLRTIETIEKNPENLILKNFDLEFSIDPLFKKTSAEFDESGTKGALLKNLECSPIDNLIIFDSSDQISIDFTDKISLNSLNEDDEKVDISYLSSIFGDSIMNLNTKTLCPTFDEYNFNNSLSDIKGTLEKLSRISPNIPQIQQQQQQQQNEIVSESENEDLIVAIENDDREGDDLQFGDYMIDDDGGYDAFDNDNSNFDNAADNNATADQQAEKTVKWSNSEVTDETGLSYFDGAFKQTWAGPEHWKIRKSQRIVNNPPGSSLNSNPVTSTTTTKSRRTSKVEKVAIDFINSVIDFRQIFSKPTTSGQISLTKAAILERNEHDHLLPDDLHFSSTSLLKLFIKPNWKITSSNVNKSTRVTRSSTKVSEPSGEFVERDFWISQNDHKNGIYQEPENNEIGNFDDDDDYYANDGVNDTIVDGYTDNDDNFFSNYGGEEPRPEEQRENNAENHDIDAQNSTVDFNKNLVAAPKFTNSSQLNYARVAKRVDVAKLKSTLWNEFVNQNAPKSKTDNTDTSKSSKNTKFSSIINNLSKSYTSETLADVSVPYCFICLLHLANENNLDIQVADNNKDLIIRN